ncbi:MAG: hypothetical protein OQL06_08355 [Gammaproteobacteria bacterium]|nr:hypothetical protein [Gammaproteobacteria bacterium]
MQFVLNIFKLLLAFVFFLTISACSNDNTEATTETVTEIPDVIQKFTLTTPGTLRAWITVDAGARTEMTIDSVAGTASATITGLTRASHTVLIEYEFTDNTGNITVTLATASNTIDLSSGDGSLAFSGTDFDTSYDDDNDGVSNMDEIANGTDPWSCLIGTSLIGNCTLG